MLTLFTGVEKESSKIPNIGDGDYVVIDKDFSD